MGPATTAATTITVPGPQLGADMFRASGDTFAAGLLSGLGPFFVGSLMKSAGAAGAGAFLRGMGPQCECYRRPGLCQLGVGLHMCGTQLKGFVRVHWRARLDQRLVAQVGLGSSSRGMGPQRRW